MVLDDAESEARILSDLTPEQRAAVTHIDGPLIVVAGPGSGKTRVITRRVAYLVARGVPPWHILAITFTNKAADEMRRRIQELCGADAAVFVSTFHSFCARMLRRYGPPGRSERYTVYDEDDQRACVKRIIQDLALDDARWRPGDVLARISDAKSRLVSAEEFESVSFGAFEETVARIYRRYEETLAQFDALDFDDLLLYTVRLLEERPEVRDDLRGRFKYILVDEYQDTNRPQYLLANLLAGKDGNLCVVGDPDQSIYKWRGADLRNILEFEKDHPSAREIRLERNYRSTRRILAAAQALIEHNVERREKTLWTENEEGEPLRLVRCTSDDEEARFIAESIADLIRADTPPAEIAVFYRTNALSRKFEEELRARSIRHIVVGAVPFFQRKEVKDVLAYLRVLANPKDEQQLRRAAALAEGFGGATLKRLEAFAAAEKTTLFEAMRRAGENPEIKARERRSVEKFVGLLVDLGRLAPGPVGPMLKFVVGETGLRSKLADSKNPQDWGRVENIEALVDEGFDHDERNPRADFRDFLDHASLFAGTDRERDEARSIKLMTLHSAKGLEFDHVFVAGVDAGILPLEREMEVSDEEEERRLLYVGLTRARRTVTITTVTLRRTYGTDRVCAPSKFLSEIPRELVERTGAGARELERPTALAYERPPPPLPSYHSSAGGRGADDVAAGDRVKHPIFGVGQVLDLTGSGIGRRVRVQFDAVGTKTLVLHYANLEKLGA